MRKSLPVFAALALLAGCGSYEWRSSVPDDMRDVAVPTFRNESEVVELGALATREVLREIQREGSFRIARGGDAALEIQGVVRSANASALSYKRESAARAYEFRFTLTADVSFVDLRSGKVLVNGRRYVVETTFYGDTDVTTGRRDASGRLAEELARQVVDDAAAYFGEKRRAGGAVKQGEAQ